MLTTDGGATQSRWLLPVLACLYFAQGVPLGYAFYAFPALLRSNGVGPELIAIVPVLGLPWVCKFLWAPVVDSYWLAALGRRKTWLLSMQCLLILLMFWLAFTPLQGDQFYELLGLLFMACVFSATQDIACDGLAAEVLSGTALIHANALSVGGMMAGVMVGGAGVLLFIETLGFMHITLLLALMLALCAVPVLLWQDNTAGSAPSAARATMFSAAAKHNFWPLFALCSVYAMVHTTENTLLKLLLVDVGWSLADIGIVTTLGSLSMIILGCGLSARLAAIIGVWRLSRLGLLVGACSCLCWLAIADDVVGASFFLVAALCVGNGMAFGLVAVSIFTLIMRFADTSTQSGTDVTLFKSGNVLGELLASSIATALTAYIGYAAGFMFGPLMALLALFFIAVAVRGGERR